LPVMCAKRFFDSDAHPAGPCLNSPRKQLLRERNHPWGKNALLQTRGPIRGRGRHFGGVTSLSGTAGSVSAVPARLVSGSRRQLHAEPKQHVFRCDSHVQGRFVLEQPDPQRDLLSPRRR
jgi:hypothetical protein